MDSFDVLGTPVSVTTPDRTHALIRSWAADDIGRFICVRDVASLMALRLHPASEALYDKAALVLPDGMPLVWIGRSRGLPVERTCGPDLMELVCGSSADAGLGHYLYGGNQGVADKLAARFRARFPGIRIVGAECPPFGALGDTPDPAVVARIKAARPDVVWVGMSSPKQDLWMHLYSPHLPQTLIGVGAAFDFHAGARPRAPRWMQKSGTEWLFRLLREPRRLWRRYLLLAPKFVLQLVSQRIALR